MRAWSAVLALCVLIIARSAADDCSSFSSYADASLASFAKLYWNGNCITWVVPSDGTCSQYWILAESLHAIIDGAQRTESSVYLELIEKIYSYQNAIGWSRPFYDDENWMAMALLDAYTLTKNSTYLQRAVWLVDDVQHQWDTTCCGSNPGGIWWDSAHSQKATASNGGPIIANVMLYQLTHNSTYLNFAVKVYDYWASAMVNTQTHEVADHIDNHGVITYWQFTYNNGLMVGAATALYQATNDSSYLEDAQQFASFMMTAETEETQNYGLILSDGSNIVCQGDCMEFKAPAFRYLAALWKAQPTQTELYTFLQNSVLSLWNSAQFNTSGASLFAIDWAGPPQTTVYASQQNAAVTATNIFAQLCELSRSK